MTESICDRLASTVMSQISFEILLPLLLLFQGQTPIDLAHQVHSPLLVHMLNHIKQERIRSSSRCLRLINRYRVHVTVKTSNFCSHIK